MKWRVLFFHRKLNHTHDQGGEGGGEGHFLHAWICSEIYKFIYAKRKLSFYYRKRLYHCSHLTKSQVAL